MKVTVQSIDSSVAEIEVTPEMTVRQFKIEISKKMSTPPSKQRLVYNGNVLMVNSNTLEQYSITDGAEVRMVFEKPPQDEKVGVLPQIPDEAVEGASGGAGEGEGGEASEPLTEKLSEQQKEEDEEQDKMTKERERRDLKDVHKNVINTKKCTEWAIKMLDRYDRAEAKRLEWKRAREAGEDMAALDKEDDPDEKPEPRKRRFPWRDEESEAPLPPFERSEYAALMTSIQSAQDRARPMIERYQSLITSDPNLSVEDGLQAERLAQTVKEFNYYIGHSLITLSRLEMTMNAPPPRPVKLAASRRNEMRRVMRDLRNMPPRAPSGYIIDIQRDGGPVPTGTKNAPAPSDPLTSVALGSKDKKKKKDGDKKDEDKKDGGGGAGASGSGAAKSEEKKDVAEGGGGGGGEGKEGEGGKGEGKEGEEPMEQEGGEKGEKKEGTEGEPKKERTRDVLAKLLTGMVSGMMGSEGDDEEEEEEEKEEEKAADSQDEDEDDPKKTFAQKYVGPPGSVVTIQSIPQPQFAFGIPSMNPQPGPSLCIRNSGNPSKPNVKVNFPMPPALQMLQDLFGGDSSSDEDEVDMNKPESELSAEEMEKKRQLLKKKEEKERKQKEREVRRKKREQEEKEKKEKEQELRRKGIETKAFTPREEADPGELSDTGSIDSIDSQHDYLEAHHIDNPMYRLLISATSEIDEGVRETVHAAMVKAYAHMGEVAPEEVDEEDGMLEMLFEAISQHLSVLETMGLMWGAEAPMKKLQPCLYEFVKKRLLQGQEPTPEMKRSAVTKFLAAFVPSIASTMMTIFPKEGVDLPKTLHSSLTLCMEEVYDIIIKKHKEASVFAQQLHQWGTKTSLLSAALLHHTARNDDLYEDAAKQLFTVFLPGETPAMAMAYPYASITRELKRMKTAHSFTPEELDKMVVYKKGRGPGRTKAKDGAGGGAGGGGGSTDSTSKQAPPPQDPTTPDSQSGTGGGGGEKEQQPSSSSSSTAPLQQQSGTEEQEWVPAIKRDREALARMHPQQPFSDAYVSGMPPKRRKMETKEPLEPGSEMMEKSLQSAIAESGATPSSGVSVDEIVKVAKTSSGLVGELDKEVQEEIKERLEKDTDYNPQQFPASEKVYQPSK